MRLTPGARLGPYIIEGPIGAGGMGEVYRARHTTLDRLVAIKVLPASLAADADARARFEREAKAVAALSHPNILAIHDFAADDATAYVVMELLEGATLRERLAGGPLPIKKAAQIARDVALGLAAAHDAGIVHRDVKPENVFITAAGHVKILDFGLARPMHVTAADDPNSPTFIRKTDPGTVMGTIGYMSPEQVKGLPADHRSDIFSLGCTLFEMVSGRQPFERPTSAETMTAVLREDPAEITRPDGAIPSALDQVVHHCLEKEPAERFQSARDLAFALQALSGGSIASGPAASPASRGRATWPLAAAAAVALLGAGVAAGHYLWTMAPEAPAQPIAFQQISDVRGLSTEPTLSPDGKTVVYAHVGADDNNLYLLRVGSRTPVLLTPNAPAGNRDPAFSPDGEHIAFRSERDGGGIFIMTATGESVRRLTDVGYNPSWSPDGKEIVVSRGRFISPTDRGSVAEGLWVVNVATGARRQVLKKLDAMQPAWSPHGQRIAYWGLRGGTGQRDLWTIAADGSELDKGPGEVTNDTAVDWSPTWSPDGGFLYFSSRRGGTMNLWRVAIDETTGRRRGQPEPVTTPSAWSGFYSFSRDGSRLAFASLNWRSTLFKVPFDPARETLTGSPVPMLKGSHAIRDHSVSPDQKWVALMESGEREAIIVARTDGSEYRRITDDDFRNRSPQWSPDGQRLLFYSDRGGTYDVWTVRPDGSGLEPLTRSTVSPNFPTWSPDGTRIAVSTVSKPWWQIIDVTHPPAQTPDDSLPQISPDTAFWPSSWSADGRRLAGLAMHADATPAGTAVYEIATRQFTVIPTTAISWVTSIWLPDNERLLVRDDRGVLLANVRTRATKLLVAVGGYSIGRSVGVTADARWITYTETGTEGEIWLATLGRK
jgi:Tol biopolymer transport system component